MASSGSSDLDTLSSPLPARLESLECRCYLDHLAVVMQGLWHAYFICGLVETSLDSAIHHYCYGPACRSPSILVSSLVYGRTVFLSYSLLQGSLDPFRCVFLMALYFVYDYSSSYVALMTQVKHRRTSQDKEFLRLPLDTAID